MVSTLMFLFRFLYFCFADTSSNVGNHQVISMAVLRRFFCFELETAALSIGSIAFFFSLVLSAAAINDRHTSAVSYLIFLLASGLLIWGTIKRNQYFLLPWMIIHFAVCVIATLVFFATIVVATDKITGIELSKGENTNHEAIKKKFSFVIVEIIFGFGYALVVYIYMAIASLHSKLEDEEQQNAVGDENQQKIDMAAHHDSPPPYYPETC